MSSAFNRIDVVGKGKNIFVVTIVILKRTLHFDIVFFLIHIENLAVKRAFGTVQILNELRNAAVVFERMLLVRTLLLNRDFNAFVEKGELSQAVRKRIKAEFNFLKDLFVRLKHDLRSGALAFADNGDFGHRFSALVLLAIEIPVAAHFHFAPLGKRVGDGNADTVKTARDAVRFGIKFAARMERGHHDFKGRLFLGFMHVHGDAAAIVSDGNA